MNIEIQDLNYLDPKQAKELVLLMDAYAQDVMGGSQALSEKVKSNLALELSKRAHAFSVIAYVNNQAAGLINCFEQFSTFACQPLINIHDIIVLSEFRGLQLSQKMLEQVELIALQKGCCKLTLEVLQNNDIAKSAYQKFGFSDYQLDPKLGNALFWQKKLG